MEGSVLMLSTDQIEVKQNLRLTLRERGKVVDRREGHNIWLNLGREWMARLMAYQSFEPLLAETDHRIRYMGLGIGGNRQLAMERANAEPLVSAYPGTNQQTDEDVGVLRLERPVRVSGGASTYPGVAADRWLGQIQAPADHSKPSEVTFRRLFGSLEVGYPPFLVCPVSEVALYHAGAAPGVWNNTAVAYDTFESLAKTTAVELEIVWTLSF